MSDQSQPLRLHHVRMSGFKAIRALSLKVSDPLTLLIGNNGAGKSSILQALGFFRYLVEGKGSSFFEERGWNPQDVRFRTASRTKVPLVKVATYFHWMNQEFRWELAWGLISGKLISEEVVARDNPDAEIETILSFRNRTGGSVIGGIEIPGIAVPGSVIATISPILDGPYADFLRKLEEWSAGITSLELMSPYAMKGSTRLSPGHIGVKGDKLAGFLASLTSSQKSRIVQRLSTIYPIVELTTTRKRAGWIDMRVSESFEGFSGIPVSQMSDGFMRLLALLSIPDLADTTTLVLLDEIEDGIEPHILPAVVDLLAAESRAQLVATSHSPLLVNHVGAADVRFVSRSEDGATIATPASEMTAFNVGSDFFGAGEMWTSSSSKALSEEARRKDAEDNASESSL